MHDVTSGDGNEWIAVVAGVASTLQTILSVFVQCRVLCMYYALYNVRYSVHYLTVPQGMGACAVLDTL